MSKPLLSLVLLAGLLTWHAPAERGEEPALRILVTNDDGIDSPGVAALVAELAELGEVVVCAPDGNRSGASQSVSTLSGPLIVEQREIAGASLAWAVSGTPADAVALGVSVHGQERPFGLVVSGINRGANVGDVAHFSGTVGAALEGVYRGIPAIAVSQARNSSDWKLSAEITAGFAARLLEKGARPGVVYSINVPLLEDREVKLLARPMAGSFLRVDEFQEVELPEGKLAYRGVASFPTEGPQGSDTAAYLDGQVTVTPLRFDWTDAQALEELQAW